MATMSMLQTIWAAGHVISQLLLVFKSFRWPIKLTGYDDDNNKDSDGSHIDGDFYDDCFDNRGVGVCGEDGDIFLGSYDECVSDLNFMFSGQGMVGPLGFN